GFWNGCGELTVKEPPPLVPSCLIAICDAAGPSGSTCCVTSLPPSPATGCSSSTGAYGANVCTTPSAASTSADTTERGSDQERAVRTQAAQEVRPGGG